MLNRRAGQPASARRHGILGLVAISARRADRTESEMARRHGILGLVAISARRATGLGAGRRLLAYSVAP